MDDLSAKPQTRSRVSVDSGGRILLPMKVRQRLGLAAGDELEVEFPVADLANAGDDTILLRVVRPAVPLRREGKFWVYRSDEVLAPVNVSGLVTAEREARSEAIMPGSPSPASTETNPEP